MKLALPLDKISAMEQFWNELCCLLSKKALLRPLGAGHPEAFYAALEN